jgi:hypothetical protein
MTREGAKTGIVSPRIWWFNQSASNLKTKQNNNQTINLGLRLLSKTKLVILKEGHCLKHAQNWGCRKRSFLGIPVPVLGRE